MRHIDRSALTRLLIAVSMTICVLLNTAGDWPTYLHDAQRTGTGSGETVLTTANAPNLSKVWSFTTGNAIGASATVVGGTVYVGSWDGYEYALDAVTGALKWKTYLGTTVDPTPGCNWPGGYGVESTATVISNTVYVGGGDANWYALDTTSGAILWSVYVGDNSPSGGYYNWSSPLIYNGYAYIGAASLCDTPVVQGKLLQVNLSTHQIVHTLTIVPNGQIGGAIWTSPSVDPATNTLYVTTGNNDSAQPAANQPSTVALLAIDANTLAIKSSWQVPPTQQSTNDSDWSTTPLLFSDSNGRALIGAVNKGGWLYAFDRTNIAAGPLWQVNVAVGCSSPENGCTSASSAAYGNGALFQAGGLTLVHNVQAAGSVRAINPTTGQVQWTRAEAAAVLAPLAYANGLVVDGTGSTLEVLNAATGTSLYSYTTGGLIYAQPVIANGRVYVGSRDNTLYAFGLASGSKGGVIATQGGSASYSITPAVSGSATVGTCAAMPITTVFDLYVYNSAGALVASSTATSYCNWVSVPVSADQAYTITTKAVSGTGVYLSAWNVNATPITWPLSGTINTTGGTAVPSILSPSAHALTASICGPAGTTFALYLLDVHGTVLASATAASNCQTLTYTPGAQTMLRVKVVAVSGHGRWSGSVTTQ